MNRNCVRRECYNQVSKGQKIKEILHLTKILVFIIKVREATKSIWGRDEE